MLQLEYTMWLLQLHCPCYIFFGLYGNQVEGLSQVHPRQSGSGRARTPNPLISNPEPPQPVWFNNNNHFIMFIFLDLICLLRHPGYWHLLHCLYIFKIVISDTSVFSGCDPPSKPHNKKEEYQTLFLFAAMMSAQI